jgi:hypothetical protein
MEKRKLSVEELQVESFATAETFEERGTVEGHQMSEPYVCHTYEFCTCNDGISDRSCIATCYNGSGCGTNPSGGVFTCDPRASCNPDDTCGGCTAYQIQC